MGVGADDARPPGADPAGAADRRADAQELVRQKGLRLDHGPLRVRPDGILLELPFLGDPELEDSLFLMRPEQLEPRTPSRTSTGSHEDAPGRGPHLRPGLPLQGRPGRAHLAVCRGAARGRHRPRAGLPGQRAARLVVPACRGGQVVRLLRGTFAVDIPMSEVVAPAAQGTTWTVLLRVEAGGFTVTGPATAAAQRCRRRGAGR